MSRSQTPERDDPQTAWARAVVAHRLLGEPIDAPRIGRFALSQLLGEGGMGRVFEAYDDQLDRKVAVKLMRHGTDERARARALREARAMAMLRHPNVVHVYEVGEQGGELFIAMELLDGATLRAWQDAAPRSWAEVLDAYLQAGRGLAAAHAAGLVHRDFKPHNAIVEVDPGGSMQVRVADFGLARRTDLVPLDELPTGATGDEGSAELDTPLTVTGNVVGTPAYMAPEQLRAEPADERTDQFSYCVALWQALFGELPFVGEDLPSLTRAVRAGERRPVPKGASVPGWLRRAVDRGLRVEPSERWPSMDALLATLERGRATARWRRFGLATGGLAVVGLASFGWARFDEARRVAACDAAGAVIDDTWNEDARQGVRAAVQATGLSYASSTSEKVVPWLDAQADDWKERRTEACLRTRVREDWDPQTAERARWCLEERRLEMRALVELLQHADRLAVQGAVTAATRLADSSGCLDDATLDRLPPPPTGATADEVDELRAELARASVLEAAGKYDDGLAAAQSVREAAEGVGWPPLIASAHVVEARLWIDTGDYAKAETRAVDGFMLATRASAWGVANAAANTVARSLVPQTRHDEARTWVRHAQAAASLAGDPLQQREASDLEVLGRVLQATGDFESARSAYERVEQLRTAALGPEHPFVARTLMNLGAVNRALGDHDRALELHERTVTIREHTLGPDHPVVATSLNELGNAHAERGELARAQSLYERALAIREAALEPGHPSIGVTLSCLGGVLELRGEHARARAVLERAVAILEDKLGPEHPVVANTLDNLAAALSASGERSRARASVERALAIREKVLGPEHPQIASSLHNLALYVAPDDHARAIDLHTRALAISEKVHGAQHPAVAGHLFALGAVHLEHGDHAQARTLLQRSVRIFDEHDGTQQMELEARLAFAKALVATGSDPAQARAQAEQAIEGLRAAGPGREADLRAAESWLEAQRLGP